jgi:hypothetical protein
MRRRPGLLGWSVAIQNANATGEHNENARGTEQFSEPALRSDEPGEGPTPAK